MLDEYEESKDEERIKRMYSEEIERAKENMNNNRMIKNNDDFELHDEEGDGREYSSDSDTESVENSFIVNDDDEIEEEEESAIDINKISDDELEIINKKKHKKLLKKKRLREEDFINEEETHEETDLNSKLNSTAKKSNIIDDED